MLGLSLGLGPFRGVPVPVPVPVISSLNFSQGDIAGGGQSIVATGTGLLSASNVRIGGADVVPTASTATTCTFTLPVHAAGAVADVAVTTPGGISNALSFTYWSPVQITNLDAYLDANKGVTNAAGVVSTWVDQGANARTFSASGGAGTKPAQVASVFGTMPAIRYSASNQYVDLAVKVTLASGMSCFAVAKWTSSTSSPTGDTGNAPLCIVGDAAGAYMAFGTSAGAICSAHYGGPETNITRGSGLNDGTARLIGATFDTTVNAKCYVGATQEGSTNTDANGLSASCGYNIVGNGYARTDAFVGDIGAVVIVSGAISGADLTKLNVWSKQRFGTP